VFGLLPLPIFRASLVVLLYDFTLLGDMPSLDIAYPRRITSGSFLLGIPLGGRMPQMISLGLSWVGARAAG